MPILGSTEGGGGSEKIGINRVGSPILGPVIFHDIKVKNIKATYVYTIVSVNATKIFEDSEYSFFG